MEFFYRFKKFDYLKIREKIIDYLTDKKPLWRDITTVKSTIFHMEYAIFEYPLYSLR